MTRGAAAASTALVLVLAAGCAQQLMPTPNLYAGAEENPFAELAAPLCTPSANVIFATDRVGEKDKKIGIRYGFLRSKSLAFGTCVVGMGKNLTWEELVEQSRLRRRTKSVALAVRQVEEVGMFPHVPPWPDEQGNMPPAGGEAAAVERLHQLLEERLAQTPTKEAYVFVHGFNNGFDDAAMVITEIWHFLGRRGVPIFYTWPAGRGADVRGYNYDRESGEFTIYHLKQFLRALASCPGLERINIIAHSRGTDVVTTALRELHIETAASGRDTRTVLRLGNVVLAAPDLDLEVVSQRITAEGLATSAQRLTVYLSETDKAIGFANWLFSSIVRLGRLRATDLSKAQLALLHKQREIVLIDARVRAGFVGHSYFHSNPAVASDLILLLRDHRDPGAENGRPLVRRDDTFWEVRDDYMRN